MSFSLKNRSIRFYLQFGNAVLAFVTFLIYLIFALVSATTSTPVLLCLIFSALLLIVSLFYDGFGSDYLIIASIALVGIGIGNLIINSVGDFTELLTPVGMYGDPANMPVKFILLGLMIVDAITSVVICFFSHKKKD